MKKKYILWVLGLLLISLGAAAIAVTRYDSLLQLIHPESGNPPSTSTPSQPIPEDESSAPSNQTIPKDSFGIRGVIEGFYGTPWTTEQRINMLSFMGQNHMNTYVYAPKDDPYQRTDWGKLYPDGLLLQMKSLVQTAVAQEIRFVYSISPGIPSPLPGETLTSAMIANSISFTSKADLQRLKNKIDQLRSIGIHTFMLSFDDVEHYLKSSDQPLYGSDYPKAHIDLANTLLKDETLKDPNFQLWFAPTDYYGLKDSSYWSAIRLHLDPSIQVIWTGKWVINQSITGSQAGEVGKLLGRKPLLWDNYPVNDYTYTVNKAPQLLMGPLSNRSQDLSSVTSGLLANPMLQSEASKVALSTIAEYLYSPSSYNPLQAWETAIRNMPGTGDGYSFRTFCQYSSQSKLSDSNNSEFANLARAFWQEYQSGKRGPAESALRKELQLLSDLPNKLNQTLSNQELRSDINPWAAKLGEEGQVGLQALAYLDLADNDPQKLAAKSSLQAGLQQLTNNHLEIGSEVLEFIKKAGSE